MKRTNEIKTKICSRKDCQLVGIEQDISCFGFKNKKKGIYLSACKLCLANYAAKRYQNNKKKINAKNAQYQKDHKEEITEYQAQYREDHKEEIAKQKAQYCEDHEEEIIIKRAQHYQDHKEEIAITNAQYRKDHKKEILEYQIGYFKKRRKNDPTFRLRDIVSHSINRMLKNNKSSKNGKSITDYLPFTFDELHNYLETLFSHPKNLHNGKVWMNWNNQGVYQKKTWNDNDSSTWKWQIDHITPHSSFKYETMDCQEFRDCWALTNLQPLSALDNLLKGNKMSDDK